MLFDWGVPQLGILEPLFCTVTTNDIGQSSYGRVELLDRMWITYKNKRRTQFCTEEGWKKVAARGESCE